MEHLRPEMLVALVLVHGAALAAPFTFSWPGFAAFLTMGFVTGCLGITLCYHRLLSHRSFKTHKWVKAFLMLCGTLSLEGDPTWWTATHRLHHRESDQEMDPHSPRVSFLWAHMLWLIFIDPRLKDPGVLDRFVPDLVRDPWARFLATFFLPINLLFLAGLFGAGYAFGGPKLGLSLLVWGGFLRIVWVWHCTWFVNSVTHIWGYRNYETRDDSRNIWWVALVTFGEGWHNNHHANPSAARSGHRWWEADITYGVIKLLQWTGLAWRILPVATTPKPAVLHALPTAVEEKVRVTQR
jgi:stearoyl-CoA desaturase (delta-9 desaturase)